MTRGNNFSYQKNRKAFSWSEVAKFTTAKSSCDEKLVEFGPGKHTGYKVDELGVLSSKLCTDCVFGQTDSEIWVYVALDDQNLKAAEISRPVEDIFRLDVGSKSMKFSLSDGTLIFSGELEGECVPEWTTWQLKRCLYWPMEGTKDMRAMYTPVLVICLAKYGQYEWEWLMNEETVIFSGFYERQLPADWHNAEKAVKCLNSVTDPNKFYKARLGQEAARNLVQDVQCRQDKTKAYLTIVFSKTTFQDVANMFKMDLNELVVVKASELTIEVYIKERIEHLVVIGVLGDKIARSGTEVEFKTFQIEGQEVLVYEISVKKQQKATWTEIFTRWDLSQYSKMMEQVDSYV